MITNDTRIADLLLAIQDAFLDRPDLMLAVPEAQRRFGLDTRTCRALLDALVDADVLMRTDEGAYVRFFPRLADRGTESIAELPKANSRAVATHAA